ncbi:MAG: methyltransferase domain-containing protein [Chloroflexota bacterium]|nr:methyltransferase domain-containing protein [Chloroflexota bacterium]
MGDQEYVGRVNAHYTPENLADTFVRVLASWGKETATLAPADLAPIDQFHAGGAAATRALAALAGIGPTTRILDVGGGFGGPARTLASSYGCSVVVLDLTEAYCKVGEMLTTRCDLSDRVSFRHGDALAIPYPDAAFDLVWTQHSSMNVADKRRLYTEIFRVLRPGGHLALYEIMAGIHPPPHYPVPWARDASISFLSSPDDTHALLTATGYRTVHWEDLTDATVAAARSRPTPAESPPGLHLVLGADFLKRARNMMRNFAEHRTALIRAVLERP